MATQVNSLHASGVQVVPTVTDRTGKLVMAGILADPIQSASLITTLTTLAVQNNFDGIDLDWEGFAFSDGSSSWPSTQPNWTKFVQQLATSLHLQRKTLSVTTPISIDPATGLRGYWVYDWPGIASSIDRLRIMTYDYSVSTPGPIGPIAWVEAAAKYAVSLIPASKVLIGAPEYGRDWVIGVTGTCPVLGVDGKSLGISIKAPSNGVAGTRATFVVKDAATLAAAYGVTPTWNDTFGENTFTYFKTYSGTNASGISTSCTARRTAWYQDARGLQLRAALVGKYRLGGIAFWTLGWEDPTSWEQLRSYARTISPDTVVGALTVDQNALAYSAAAVLTATFKISDSSPVAGLTIVFQVMKNNDSTWQDIGTSMTSANGTAQVSLVSSQNLQVRALSRGTWERLAASSAPQKLNVKRQVSVRAPASMRRGLPLVVTGSMSPAEAGIGVALQLNSTGSWKEIATGITGADGTYSLVVKEETSGIFAYRVRVKENSKFAEALTPPFTLLVR